MDDPEKALSVRIHGKVQGVGFRAWAVKEATQLGLTGTVRNEADGSVLAIVVGPETAANAMIERLRDGPPGAHVVNVDARPIDINDVPTDFRAVR